MAGKGALSSSPPSHIRRFQTLAAPKCLPAGFSEDRRSVYWENNIPRKDYTKTTSFVLSPWQEQLVYSKRLHPDYVGDRPSPIWPVSRRARSASASTRVTELAHPKSLHLDYQPCREVMTIVPPGALRVRPSERLSLLSRHKTYPPLPIKHRSEWDWGEWESDINPGTKTALASSRVVTLATPKMFDRQYQPCREVQWPVKREALFHMASEQVQKLSQPKRRNGDKEDYDPKAWMVSRGALLAQASPRISELAVPPPRKCRSKK